MRGLFAVLLVVMIAGAGCEPVAGPDLLATGTDDTTTSSGSPLLAPLDTPYVSRMPADTSFWAYRGRELDVVLRFTPVGGAPGDSLLEFHLGAGSLLSYPDGHAFADGDSVLITIRPDRTGKMGFVFEPSGLAFDPAAPGWLRMWCTHAAADLNGDGVVNTTDEVLWYQMAVWRRETPLDPWEKLTTTRNGTGELLSAPILGFTGFSVAS